MANLVIPRREIWTRQPAGAIEIDWNNPLSAGLVFDAGAYSRMCNTAIKKPTQTTAGSYQHSASAYGQSVTMASAVHSYGADDIFGGSDQATFQIIELPNNLTQASGIINKRNAALSVNAFSLGYNYTTGSEFSVEFGNSSGVGGSVGAAYSFSRGSFSTLGNRLVCRLVGSAASQQKIQLWRNGLPVSIARAPGSDNIITGIYGGIAPLDIGRVNNGTLYYGGKIVLIRMWRRALSDDEIQSIDENPWQVFAPKETRLFVPIGGGSVNASASGAFHAVSVTTPTAGASGSASASGSLASISITPATATASAGGSATASGSFAALSITPATATATAGATASGALAAISLSAPSATATGTTAGNAVATGTPAQITISQATASAIGSAIASGSFAAISVSPPSATASSAGHAQATAAFAALSINPATGAAYGSAIATGSLPVISVSPATGTASNGVDIDEQYPLAGLSQTRPLAGLSQTYPLGN